MYNYIMEEKAFYRIFAAAFVVIVVSFYAGWFARGQIQQTPKEKQAPVAELREGIYGLVGKIPGSTEGTYTGEVEIVRSGNIYDLVWKITDQTQRGVGILNNGILSVGYIDVTGGDIKDAGAVSYAAVSNELLTGQWASVVGGDAGEETLTWKGQPSSSLQANAAK